MAPPMLELLKSRLSPFKHRHFRNFFFAQTLSMIGTFSHDLARSWIIVEAMGTSGALGNMQMAVAVPCMMLILHGGVYVDNANVRKLLMMTKCLLGLGSMTLALMSEFSTLQYWHLLVYGVVEGSIMAFDSPAFTALVVKIVPKEDFRQAVALNSTNFHTSRMLGPVIAGLLMNWHGPSLVFLMDGLSYFLIAYVLRNVEIRQLERTQAVASKGWHGLKEGLRYIYRDPGLRYRIGQLFITLTCVMPMVISIFRVYIQQKFNLNSAEFGTVFMFPALGSMGGAFTFALIQPKNPLKALLFGVPGSLAGLLALPHMPTLAASTVCMSVIGFALYLCFASLTVSMQIEVEDRFRGRLSSVIQMGFFGIAPVMSGPWGHLADAIGAESTFIICSLLFGWASLVLLYFHRPLLRELRK